MTTRVLVVDDESDTLNLLRTILEISGYDPVTTLNSVDALMIAEVEKPDVVLLDIMMPRLDGFTLCKLMRAHSATKHLPIIFVSAYSALDIEDRRIEAGADLVISKPISMDNLIETISQALKKRPPVSAALPPAQKPAQPGHPVQPITKPIRLASEAPSTSEPASAANILTATDGSLLAAETQEAAASHAVEDAHTAPPLLPADEHPKG